MPNKPVEIAHLKRWQFVLGYVVLVIGIVIALAMTRHVAQRTDTALCRQQRLGTEVIRRILVDARALAITSTPPEDRTERFDRSIKFYDEKIAELDRPIPCEEELDLP